MSKTYSIVAHTSWLGWLSLGLWVPLSAACGDGANGGGGRDPSDVSDTDTSEPVCNPVSDTGCPDDETCSWLPSSANPVCVRRGPVPLEDLCSTTEGCERGVCLSLNASAERCYAICERDADCGVRGTCLTLTGSPFPFKVCRIEGVYDVCDLLEQDCEPSRDTDRGCYVVPSEATPVCLPAGDLEPDDVCASLTDCRPSYTCNNDVCAALCDTTATAPCGPLHLCRPFAHGAGVCEPR